MVIKNIKDTFAGRLRNSKIYNDQYISISQLGLAVDLYIFCEIRFLSYLLLISHLNIRTVRNHIKSIVKYKVGTNNLPGICSYSSVLGKM